MKKEIKCYIEYDKLNDYLNGDINFHKLRNELGEYKEDCSNPAKIKITLLKKPPRKKMLSEDEVRDAIGFYVDSSEYEYDVIEKLFGGEE